MSGLKIEFTSGTPQFGDFREYVQISGGTLSERKRMAERLIEKLGGDPCKWMNKEYFQGFKPLKGLDEIKKALRAEGMMLHYEYHRTRLYDETLLLWCTEEDLPSEKEEEEVEL